MSDEAKEKRKAYQRAYRKRYFQEHHAEVLASMQLYHQTHRAEEAAYYQEHRDEKLAYEKGRYQLHCSEIFASEKVFHKPVKQAELGVPLLAIEEELVKRRMSEAGKLGVEIREGRVSSNELPLPQGQARDIVAKKLSLQEIREQRLKESVNAIWELRQLPCLSCPQFEQDCFDAAQCNRLDSYLVAEVSKSSPEILEVTV